MKLPGIEGGGSVEGVANAGAPGAAFAGLSKTISEGLQLYSQELVKTQAQRASVKLSDQLENLSLDLRSRKYVSASELRDALGADADRLPPHVQAQLQKRDPQTGDLVDNDEIPMWAVQGAIFDAQAKRALDSAASEITVGGNWKEQFKEHAAGAVAQRRLKINEHALAASMQYMRETQLRDIDQMRNTAVTPQEFADIRAAIGRSNALAPEEKGAELLKTKKTQQLRPVWDAMRLNDPVAIKSQIARLNGAPGELPVGVKELIPNDGKKPIIENADGSFSTEKTVTITVGDTHRLIPTIVDGKDVGDKEAIRLHMAGQNPAVAESKDAKAMEAYAVQRHNREEQMRSGDRKGAARDDNGTDAIEPEHRKMYVEQLESQLKKIESEQKAKQKEARQEVMNASWRNIFNAQEQARKQGRPVSSAAYSLLPRPETVDPDDWRQAHAYIDNLTKGVEPKTDPALYAALSRSATDDLENFKADKITFNVDGKPKQFRLIDLVNQLSPSDFTKFTDLQRTAREAGAGSPQYSGFLSSEEKVNQRLTTDLHYDLKATDEATLKAVGHLKGMVNAALVAASAAKNNGKGGKLDPAEEDTVITDVFNREVKTKKNSLLYRLIPWTDAEERTLGAIGVRPEVATALYNLSSRGGKEFTPEQVIEQAKDYAFYEPGVLAAWKAKAGGKPLKPDVAVQIYAQLKRDWTDIDARLAKAGKLTGKNETDNALRTALAVQGYLKGIR